MIFHLNVPGAQHHSYKEQPVNVCRMHPDFLMTPYGTVWKILIPGIRLIPALSGEKEDKKSLTSPHTMRMTYILDFS